MPASSQARTESAAIPRYSGPLTVAANTTTGERTFVLPPTAFNQISEWADLTVVLQELLGTKVSIVQEAEKFASVDAVRMSWNHQASDSGSSWI